MSDIVVIDMLMGRHMEEGEGRGGGGGGEGRGRGRGGEGRGRGRGGEGRGRGRGGEGRGRGGEGRGGEGRGGEGRGRGGEGEGKGSREGEPSELHKARELCACKCAVLELFTIDQLQVYPCLLGVVHIACTYVRILAGLYWDILEYTGIYWNILEYAGIYWDILYTDTSCIWLQCTMNHSMYSHAPDVSAVLPTPCAG